MQSLLVQGLVTIIAVQSILVIAAPCAEITELYKQWSLRGGQGDLVDIPGDTAYSCLRSMPFQQDLAVRFLDEYLKYLQFQSTIEILKKPPASYPSPSIDLLRGIDKIRRKVHDGRYSSQYDFDDDIKSVATGANDGHLRINLCSHNIFHFRRQLALVSISEDGTSSPVIYTYSDAKLRLTGSLHVSHLTEINGVDAVYFLEANLAIHLSLQDPDARYNHVFPSSALEFSGNFAEGAWRSNEGLWPGAASYMLKFANGTVMKVTTTAIWPMTNGPMQYADGGALFEGACIPGSTSPMAQPLQSLSYKSTISSRPKNGPIGKAAYPRPISSDKNDLVRGYYLDDPHHNSTAILQLPTFRLRGTATALDFSRAVVEFLDHATAADNKTRLIIDLSGNTGGDIVLGFNIFKILFPNESIYSATRFRATELVNLMGKIFSHVYDNKSTRLPPIDPPLIAQAAVNTSQKPAFFSWNDLYSPVNIMGANMSQLYGHFDFNLASTPDNPIFGFRVDPSLLNASSDQIDVVIPPRKTPYFSPKDIILITDGQCASTCALLATLLLKSPNIKGIRSIVFGGRPRAVAKPMQALGGVRGGQYWSLATIYRYASQAYDAALNASMAGSPILSESELARLKDLVPTDLGKFPLRFGGGQEGNEGGVNFRNAYGEGDDDTPLQFVYEPADCRLFYTAENVVRPATVWVAAARAMFGDGGLCAKERGQGLKG
ncbi:peptidase S41 family protein [Bombardia bombarda]|uniref:Peptidase S41 family protein n=1 Tax=Bombardia bombarda TaxID=252184 RepID=A0AA40BVJ8_9PEZI|nr:peptidase S41 family protein [Bombardia bombarda]